MNGTEARTRLKLLIVEPEASGHHMRYVRSLVSSAQARNHDVVLATTAKAKEHAAFREFQDELKACNSVLKMVTIHSPTPPFVRRFSRMDMLHRQWLGWLSFRAGYRSLLRAGWRPDFVLLPYLNDIDLMIALVGSPFSESPWGGIVMRERFHHSQVNPWTPDPPLCQLRRWFFDGVRKAPGMAALVTIDETLSKFRYPNGDSGPKPTFIPEPSELQCVVSRSEARRQLGIPESGEYVLLYGHLNRTKGVFELVRAIEALQDRPPLNVLVIGNVDSEVRHFLETDGEALRAKGRLIVLDQFASLHTEALAFSAADLVWVGYSHHYGPSSVLGKAATAGRPVVGCREGVIGWTIERFGTGVAVDVSDPAAVGNALLETLFGPTRATFCNNAERYAQQHQCVDFSQSVLDLVERAVENRQVRPAVENRGTPLTV